MSVSKDGDGARAALDAEALHAAWRERIGTGEDAEPHALALVEADEIASGALAAAVLAAGDGIDAESGGLSDSVHGAAESVGRAAGHAGADLATLQTVFGGLHDALFGVLLEARAGALDEPVRDDATRCVREATRAVRPVAVAAEQAWFDERGRAFRHDIKTPLQAASLNLELLALESGEKGIDTEALDLIQRSLDQAVEMLRRLEPGADR